MTKNEALKAAIDGKKIRNDRWMPECYLCFKENQFFVIGPSAPEGNSLHSNGLAYSTGNWQIVPEYVDFAEALKAYRNSATIKSITGEKYSLKREDESLCVNLKEIEGKWLILEDE